MILADTSIWVDHLRSGDQQLEDLLLEGEVLMHPFIIGEIALGHLPKRLGTLQELQELPAAKVATDTEVLRLIEANNVVGSGIGYVDVHLLASALLMDCPFWTRDKRLVKVTERIGRAPSLH